MSAESDLKAGIKALSEKMLEFDGTEGKTKADADEYYATELSNLIDSHSKALVSKLLASQMVPLGLVAGPYPVTAPVPTNSVKLQIVD